MQIPMTGWFHYKGNSATFAVGKSPGRGSSRDCNVEDHESHHGCCSSHHHPKFLQLTPVNTATIPLNGLEVPKGKKSNNCQRRSISAMSYHRKEKHRAELISTISTLYAKLLIIVGVTVPVTASVSHQVPAALDQRLDSSLKSTCVKTIDILANNQNLGLDTSGKST
ncbi:hypothetical protein PV325_012205 [Microctonus aethiopoides]|nr:hypothetical protein PV325_012205 [Microctonus aethiopoides]